MTAAQDSRAQFEAWHVKYHTQSLEHWGHTYRNAHVRCRWEGWQASRAALSAEPVAVLQGMIEKARQLHGLVRAHAYDIPDEDPRRKDMWDAQAREAEEILEYLISSTAPQPAAQERKPTPASRDCTRPECMSHGCFGHCMRKAPST